jgi:replicative DNA helicase
VKLVVVDYLQKIKCAEKSEKRTYEVAEVSGKLKDIATQTGVAVLCLAQLNRESEKDKGRLPRLTDLADSGQIERDADLVMLLDRDRKQASGEAQIVVAKQRDGECGLVKLHYEGQFCRFSEYQIDH